mgnify:CR=1 FL=1
MLTTRPARPGNESAHALRLQAKHTAIERALDLMRDDLHLATDAACCEPHHRRCRR